MAPRCCSWRRRRCAAGCTRWAHARRSLAARSPPHQWPTSARLTHLAAAARAAPGWVASQTGASVTYLLQNGVPGTRHLEGVRIEVGADLTLRLRCGGAPVSLPGVIACALQLEAGAAPEDGAEAPPPRISIAAQVTLLLQRLGRAKPCGVGEAGRYTQYALHMQTRAAAGQLRHTQKLDWEEAVLVGKGGKRRSALRQAGCTHLVDGDSSASTPRCRCCHSFAGVMTNRLHRYQASGAPTPADLLASAADAKALERQLSTEQTRCQKAGRSVC